VGEPYDAVVDPQRAVAPRDARDPGRLTPRARGLLEHSVDTRLEREADRERVLRADVTRGDDAQGRAQRVELTEPRPHLVDRVRTRCTEPATARTGLEPPCGYAPVGVGHEGRELHERREAGLADHTLRDRAAVF